MENVVEKVLNLVEVANDDGVALEFAAAAVLMRRIRGCC